MLHNDEHILLYSSLYTRVIYSETFPLRAYKNTTIQADKIVRLLQH